MIAAILFVFRRIRFVNWVHLRMQPGHMLIQYLNAFKNTGTGGAGIHQLLIVVGRMNSSDVSPQISPLNRMNSSKVYTIINTCGNFIDEPA